MFNPKARFCCKFAAEAAMVHRRRNCLLLQLAGSLEPSHRIPDYQPRFQRRLAISIS
jgi:hypothetical protein